MDFISLPFLLFAFILVVAFHAWCGINYRKLIFTLGNLVFLGFLIQDFRLFLPIFFFLLVTYVSIHFARKTLRSTIVLSVLVALFIWLKRYSFFEFVPQLGFNYTTVGLSYILFRCLHLVDYFFNELQETPPGPVGFFNYTCSFLTFISGPIGFYQPFKNDYETLHECKLEEDSLFQACSRIVTGALKISYLSAFFNTAVIILKTHPLALDFPTVGFIFSSFSYMFFMYFNFSGYMDIVIGLGKLLGFSIPENFNYPFSANNMLDFWSRWHITLSEWFKTYLFNPLVKKLMYTFGNHKSLVPYLGALAFFIVFFSMGMWHGTTPAFLVYGVFLGLGVSLNKFYQVYMTKSYKESYRSLKGKLWYQMLSRSVTTTFFAYSLTCLRYDYTGLQVLTRELGLLKLVGVFGLAVLSLTLFWMILESILKYWPLPKTSAVLDTPWVRNFWLTGKIYLFIAAAQHAQVIPTFVYKVF